MLGNRGGRSILPRGTRLPRRHPDQGGARPRAGLALLLGGLFLLGGVGCAHKQVERIEPTSVTDLSGRWNDTDSRLVARALIQQSLDAPWAASFAERHGGERPTVVVGDFRNRTLEHVPVNTFVNDLERAFLNSGRVQVVARPGAEREAVRAEREDQQEHSTSDTRARLAREMGADFMLQGELQAIEDEEGREKVVYYQVDATLVNLESNVKVWSGQHRIKKLITRGGIGF